MVLAWILQNLSVVAMCDVTVVIFCIFSRYYAYMYFHWVPKELLNIVSRLQVCEDILFNFLVAHVVRHPPIKLSQRHSVGQSSSLSTYQVRMLPPADGLVARRKLATRHYCLNRFVEEFGYMPLLRSEVRYDPLLYKDNVSVLRKKYRHMENPLWCMSIVLLVIICKVFYSLHVMCVCVCYSKTIVLCLTSFTTFVKNARLKWHEYWHCIWHQIHSLPICSHWLCTMLAEEICL